MDFWALGGGRSELDLTLHATGSCEGPGNANGAGAAELGINDDSNRGRISAAGSAVRVPTKAPFVFPGPALARTLPVPEPCLNRGECLVGDLDREGVDGVEALHTTRHRGEDAAREVERGVLLTRVEGMVGVRLGGLR